FTLQDTSSSRTLLHFVDNNNSVVRASGPLLLQSGGATSAITLDASQNATFGGNVGIGGAPDSDSGLHLKGDGKRILVDSDDYNLVSLGRRGSSGAGLDKAYLRMRNASTNIVVLDTDGASYFNGGSVGIGTASPNQIFHIKNTGQHTTMRIENDNADFLIQAGDAGDDGLHFYDNGNTAYRMTIDNAGQVGISETSPEGLLHIKKGNSGTTYSADAADQLILENSSSVLMDIRTPTGNTGGILFSDADARGRGIIQYAHANDYMYFTSGGADAMQLTSTGQLILPVVKGDTTSDAANMNIRSSDGLVRRSTSSRRYKNTITDAIHGLTELLALRPVTYKGNNDGDRLFGGLIAEEVHEAGLTEFVQYNSDDEPDALAYGHMVSLCIKAIQEQQAQIEALQSKVEALENG
ncbi:MAG: hypothetical protein CMF11_00070, partial [Idiomarina sp.]|nr:hypothetical protein [Idiomarina sp.]